ncbi:MAG: hypothetical protein NVS3B26_04530 [Mycobacteriales bacterium]
MVHDPEREVMAYLAGGFRAEQRSAFSAHLMDCQLCWKELQSVQLGRQFAEAGRVVAPAHLRERIRGLVLAEERSEPAGPGRARPRRRVRFRWRSAGLPASVTGRRVIRAVPLAVVVLLTLVLLSTTLSGPDTHSRTQDVAADPPPLVAAVADYRAHDLPGRQLPTAGAPDLSRLKLLPIGAGGGTYDGLAVDGYAYQDSAGRRLVVYLSTQPFPTAVGARRLQGPNGPWTAQRADVTILCARAPHALLLVAQDGKLVQDVATELGVL